MTEETEAGVAEDQREMIDACWKKTIKCDEIRAIVSKVEKGLAALHDALEANKEKILELYSQVTLGAAANTRLAMLVKDHGSN